MNERRISVPSDAAQLAALSQFLHDFWSQSGLPVAAASAFELALEEVFMNVVMHGSGGKRVPWVEVSLTLVDDGVTLTVEDDGPPFDPLSLPAPDLSASLDGRPVGGLGVFLVRKVMDSVRYQRREASNRLTLSKRVVGDG